MIDYSLQDLLNKHNIKINEIIENLLNQNDVINYLKNEGIKKEVIEEVKNYFNNSNYKLDGGIF